MYIKYLCTLAIVVMLSGCAIRPEIDTFYFSLDKEHKPVSIETVDSIFSGNFHIMRRGIFDEKLYPYLYLKLKRKTYIRYSPDHGNLVVEFIDTKEETIWETNNQIFDIFTKNGINIIEIKREKTKGSILQSD